MKLLPQIIRKKIPALYSSESTPLQDKLVICKFFNPTGFGTWYVVEGKKVDCDFIFFGLIDLHNKNLGYFSLNELENLKLPYGLKVKRDIHFIPTKLSEFLPKTAA